jgi:PhoH-like ATPase
MERKTFVIDTNVLLHDPNSLKRFENNDVVIPLIVLEELDLLKHKTTTHGRNAKLIVEFINSIKLKKEENFNEGITLLEGPKIKIFLDHKIVKVKNFPLPLDRNVNKILSIAYNLKQQGKRVVFVSKDFVSRVKAEAMQLESQDYKILKSASQKIYKGIKTLQAEKRDIDLFYKDGSIEKPNENFMPNEYCILKSQERSSAVCKFNCHLNKLEPLIDYKKSIWGLYPLNVEQRCAFDLLLRDDIKLVTLVGPAGSGKTLLALACGMTKTFDESVYSKILISRPIIPLGKDIGFLPGTKEEKLFHWMQPIYDNLEVLCRFSTGEMNDKSIYDWVLESKKIEMEAVTYIRGRTLPNLYMIVDEAQNLTPHEVKTIISRAGKGTKVILTGDPSQIDNPFLDQYSNGLSYVISKFQNQKLFGHVYLDKTERSELAKIACDIM